MKNLKKIFIKYKISGYIVPKNDEYFNEYVHSSDDRLKYITNFSGSAGFAIILQNKSFLFVDGRYTIQAGQQSGNKFKIITIPKKFPKDVIKTKKKIVIGYDPKLHTEKNLEFFFKIKNITLKPLEYNLVDQIWKKKPKKLIKPFYTISKNATGKTTLEKIKYIQKILIKNKIDHLLVTAPENIAWLLNIRGYDALYSPIPNSRLLININGRSILFANPTKYKIIQKKLNKKIFCDNESKIEKYLMEINKKNIYLDSLSCSFYYKKILSKKNKIVEKIDPIHFLKSIKNFTEIRNMEKAHLIDGVALTKFLIWLKNNFKVKKITEISAQRKLENFRKMNVSYKFPSFSTISGSGPNGAIIHYKVSQKTNRILKRGDLYLVDSGGQYLFGTTDVTRTISLDNNSKHIKEIYTRVLKGHIAVSNFSIKNQTTGSDIDKIARKYLNKINLDYPHGTGHGVGYFLNVHEGPQSLSKKNKVKLKNGMIISNEPGYYKEGAFGIRIENLVYIKKNKFEELTLAPIDKDLINKDILTFKEINWINSYHRKVKKCLIKFMNLSEKVQLSKACSPI